MKKIKILGAALIASCAFEYAAANISNTNNHNSLTTLHSNTYAVQDTVPTKKNKKKMNPAPTPTPTPTPMPTPPSPNPNPAPTPTPVPTPPSPSPTPTPPVK